jgi:hypothetical protein
LNIIPTLVMNSVAKVMLMNSIGRISLVMVQYPLNTCDGSDISVRAPALTRSLLQRSNAMSAWLAKAARNNRDLCWRAA